MKIGAYALPNSVFVAPMAGITDRPFRRLARRYGAALAVSEMVSARPELRGSRKTLLRIDHAGEPGPASVQIAGADPQVLAEAGRFNGGRGRAIHGRPRASMSDAAAQDDPITEVKTRAAIPVIANGDIAPPEQAKLVLARTGADGIMIGRAAQGRPWLFREITHYLGTG